MSSSTYSRYDTFCVYTMRISCMWSNCSFQASYRRTVGVFFPRCSATPWSIQHRLVFTSKQRYVCLQDNTWMLSWCLRSSCLGRLEKPHLFLCSAGVFRLSARHCECVPETQASSLIPCQMKGYSNSHPCLTLLYQGKKMNSSKAHGVFMYFPLPVRKLRG